MAVRNPLLPNIPGLATTGQGMDEMNPLASPPPSLDSTGQGMNENPGAGLSTTGQGMNEAVPQGSQGLLDTPTRLPAGGSMTIPPTAMALPPTAMGRPADAPTTAFPIDFPIDFPPHPGVGFGVDTPTATTTPATSSGAAAASGSLHVPGFDDTKLNDPNLVGPGKYSPAVKHFASQIGNLPPTTASLSTIVASAQASGFPNAKVVGSDRIDYGDGMGPIDVITDVGGAGAGWWFQNGPDRLGPAATPAPTPGPGGGGGVVGDWGPGGTTPGGSGGGGGLSDIIKNLLGPHPASPSLPPGFGGPGDSGAFPSPNTQQVGQDPDSLLYTSALAGLIKNGGTPYGSNVAQTLADVIGGGGANLPSAGANAGIDALIKQFSGGGAVAPQIRTFLQSLMGTAASPSGGGGSVAPTGGIKPSFDPVSGTWSTPPGGLSTTGQGMDESGTGTGTAVGSGQPPSAYDSILNSGGANTPMANIMAQLDAIMNGGDTLDPAAKRNRLIATRDSEAGAFMGQMADARGLLAERGGLSQPGVNQGTENSAIGRISTSLAQPYANAVRDIETSDMDRANANRMTALGIKKGALDTETGALLTAAGGHDTHGQNAITNILQSLGLAQTNEAATNSNLIQAQGLNVANAQHADDAILQSLSLATGLSQSQAQNVLAATKAGTDRQTALSDIALKTLAQNQEWNKFLAEFGLNHDMVMEQMQNGRISAIVPLLQLLLSAGSVSTGGYI